MAYVSDTRTFEQIVVDLCNALRQKDIGLTNFSTGSVIRAIVDTVSSEVEMINANLDGLNGSFNLDNRAGEELDFIGDMLGIYRKDPTTAMGEVTFYTGDAPATRDITIPAGYVVASCIVSEEDESYEFEVVSATTLASGTKSVTAVVQAVESGAVSIPIGNLNVLSTTLSGINSCMNEHAIISGSGVQSDDEYRDRIRNSRKSIGGYSALKEAIESVDGVKKAFITDHPTQAGTIEVTVAYDSTNSTYNTTNVYPSVVSAVVDNKPVGIKYTIGTPTYHTFAVTVTTSAQLTATQQNKIKQMLDNYADSVEPYGTFYNTRAEQMINNYLQEFGIYGYCYIGGLRNDFTCTEGKLISVSGYTFTVISSNASA